jgi:hypothetical protein
MTSSGNLLKMRSAHTGENKVGYYLDLGEERIFMNSLVGKQIELTFTGVINCISCGKVTKKSFAQGFCFICMQTAPEAEECVLRPALCKAHMGVARDMEYAKQHCLKPHFVYLANAGDVKVGITRESQIPTRWIDQGASSAIKICMTPNRHIAGLIEMHLGKSFTDKTSWKRMVTNNVDATLNLHNFREKALSLLTPEMLQFMCDDEVVYNFEFPVVEYPVFPAAINLDSSQQIKGVLKGIKGQYLLFDNDRVMNVRKHSGYFVRVDY